MHIVIKSDIWNAYKQHAVQMLTVSAIRVLALSEDNSKPKQRSLTPVHKPLTITNTFILCEVLFVCTWLI